MVNIEAAAKRFLLRAMQEWGQTDKERAEATADYLRAAGFKVIPSGFPVFGAMFRTQKMRGQDAEAAYAWLHGTLEGLRRGEFNSEVEQLRKAAADRQTVSPVVSD
jgi:hypothetical protein